MSKKKALQNQKKTSQANTLKQLNKIKEKLERKPT